MKRKNRSKKTKHKFKVPKFLYWLVPTIIILIIIIYIIMYMNAVNHVSVENTDITKIANFSSKGFTTYANIKLENPSNVNLHAKQINYTLELGGNKDDYKLKDIYLPKHKTTTIQIKPKVSYGFTYDFVKDRLLGSDNTTLYLKGEITIINSPILITIPFEGSYDMKDELTDYLTKKAKDGGKDLIDKTKKFINNLFH